jgi:hypothetical protein
MEWSGFIRRTAWKNAGFASLRHIRSAIADTEPRHDPTVFPLVGAVPEESTLQNAKTAGLPSATPSRDPAAQPYYSVADYRALFLSGDLTPLDVVQVILPFIRRDTSPPGEHSLGWIDVNMDEVMEAAEASTLRYKEKRSLGPLDGVPTAVKDEFDMKGYATTLGSANNYAAPVLEDDSSVSWCVRKLAEAGAIIIGKTSMHEFGLGRLFS